MNLVLWEDWPRKTPEKRDDAEQDGCVEESRLP